MGAMFGSYFVCSTVLRSLLTDVVVNFFLYLAIF